MKKRNNTIRWIILVLLLGWAVYVLMPSYQIYFSKETAEIDKIKLKKEYSNCVEKQKLGKGLTYAEEALLKEYKDTPISEVLTEADLEKLNHYGTLKNKSLSLGLDLQGGMHLVLEIDYEQMLKNIAKNKTQELEELLEKATKLTGNNKEEYFNNVEKVFQEKQIPMSKYFGKIGRSDEQVIAEFDSAATKGIVTTLEILRNRIDQFGISEPSIQKHGDHRIIVELPGVKDEERAKGIVNQSAFLEFKLVAENKVFMEKLDAIDNILKQNGNINEAESNNQKDNSEAKEAADLEKAGKDSVNKSEDPTALFNNKKDSLASDNSAENNNFSKDHPFRSLLISGMRNEVMVAKDNRFKVNEILKKTEVRKILGQHEFVWKNKPFIDANQKEYYELYLVDKKAGVTGTNIVQANATMSQGDQSVGGWQVNFEFDKIGTRKFAFITGKNIGRRLAIILDGRLYMAPNIQSKIGQGRGQITGGFSAKDARDLAIVLRAGALPAPLEIMEQRVIGPSLGGDSIRSGLYAALGGLFIVILFMMFYYKLSGVFATVALVLNIVFMLAVLAYFKATLTLPGIAGVILTIGMAVDANVLIFERIKEERKLKKTVLSAVNAGYEKAFNTIFDANITTFIAGVVLYQFGTGPIKGFALTLMIGIMCSMYTAIVVTRLLTDIFINKDSKKINI